MAEGMLNGGETGVDVNGPQGDFSVVIPSVSVLTCEDDTQRVQLQGKIIAACHQINPNGSETWNAMMQQASSTKKFSIQAIAATPAQNNRALLLKIFSTLTFQ